jgi:hypothetical protein
MKGNRRAHDPSSTEASRQLLGLDLIDVPCEQGEMYAKIGITPSSRLKEPLRGAGRGCRGHATGCKEQNQSKLTKQVFAVMLGWQSIGQNGVSEMGR